MDGGGMGGGGGMDGMGGGMDGGMDGGMGMDGGNDAGRKLSPTEEEFFESKIRPVLVQSCYKCHSSRGKVRAGLKVDTRDDIRRGGDSGPAVVPGNVDASLLLRALSWSDPTIAEMPPSEKLPADVIANFRLWVKMGAPDPRVPASTSNDAAPPPANPDPDTGGGDSNVAPSQRTGINHWAFRKPERPALPDGGSWARTAIDRFVLQGLNAAGLKPVKDAGSGVMLRRIHVDLVGLPPTPEEIDAFELAWKRDSDKAIMDEVDRLMASPQFGERWGRHWLDYARFAESNGAEPQNVTYPHAWRYRNYVIDAINADVPYDRFIREQIAGDLLAKTVTDKAEQDRLRVATGFLALGPKNLREGNTRQFAADMVDEQIDAISRATFGLTV
ncbi:MAG: DUF1549 domain-containing protein, partial [Planctomycetota bacterium]